MSSQVQGTNDSSIVSKHSIVQQGYFKDDYIHHFVCKYARRSPLINIGYYVRAVVIEKVLLQFLKDMQQFPAVQILSLGAGFDTSFFRLNDLPESKNLTYFEIDLPAVVMRKANIINNSKELLDKLTNIKVGFSDDGLWSEKYRLMSGDLRNLSRIKEILSRFQFENGTPTLILSECSVTYMDEESSRRLIKFVEELLEDAIFITYEQVGPDDGFGSVMIRHFISIDSPLLSVSTYPTLKSQEKRFSNQGWKESCAVSVWEAFVNLTSEEERFRACSLEPFDEWEEWHLKCNHYTLVVAAKGSLDSWVPFKNFRKLTRGTPQSNLFFNLDLKWMPKLKQFGHSSVLVTANNRSIILNIGGFGQIEDGPHRRIDKIRYVELDGDRCSDINTLDTDVVFNCLYHSCTVFEETECETKMILYGGRASPLKCVNRVPVLINCNLTENKLSVDTNFLIKTNSDNETSLNAQPEPRWRHSACIIDFNNCKTFLVFGGCSKELKVFGDFWKIDLNNAFDYCWEQIICSKSPCPRFSHSAIVQGDNMIISGGINSKLEVMNDIWMWNHKTKLWTEVLVTNMFPRYAHTSHVILNKLVLVGGVSTQRETWPMVTVVDLVALNCTEYYHPFQSLEVGQTYMLHNHSSVLRDGSSIYVIGGGGNCFSFGTKFNTCILVIPLPFL